MESPEDRIALFLDFENLAIGAREDLGGFQFDLRPVADALAERGRVVVRRAYGDWNLFAECRGMLSEHHVEMIEIPQRIHGPRKNAADIKMAVDAIELSFERDYITTFVLATGDSDFTPLVHKLRELNKRVVGIGLRDSTSKLLPAACDEFLFYDSLDGVEAPQKRRRRKAADVDIEIESVPDRDPASLEQLVTQTLSGLQRSGDGVVLASRLKRAIIRKDPTFSEADYGFRAFGELLRNLASKGTVELTEGPARGDPEVTFKQRGGHEETGCELRLKVVTDSKGSTIPLSGIKDAIRKVEPGFSEKDYGYRGFLQFSRAAETRGLITMEWSDDAEDYLVGVGG